MDKMGKNEIFLIYGRKPELLFPFFLSSGTITASFIENMI